MTRDILLEFKSTAEEFNQEYQSSQCSIIHHPQFHSLISEFDENLYETRDVEMGTETDYSDYE